MICLNCKYYYYDEIYIAEINEEQEIGYCTKSKETDKYSTACDEFEDERKENKPNEFI